MMSPMISVALGGALGAVMRYAMGLVVGFPIGTMVVNILGSFAIGTLWVVLAARGLQGWTPFLITGLLGGFTTFSAFSLDALRLVEAGRLWGALGYVFGSVIVSLLACALGLWAARGTLA